MNGQLRPVGIVMSLVGNVLFAIGFGTLIRIVNDVSATATGFDWTNFIPMARPLAMLGVGYTTLRFAPRFGGGSLGVQFFLIGASSMWNAFHTSDGTERFVNATIGGTFLVVSIIGLVGIAMVYGWKHSLTHPSPVILRRNGVVQPLNAVNLADALRAAAKLQVSGIDPASVAAAKSLVRPTPDALTPEQRSIVMNELASLEAAGTLTPEQVAAVKAWTGQPQSPDEPAPTPEASP